MTSVMIRVTPADFDSWRSDHESCRPARRGFAVTSERLYRELDRPYSALVELETTDLARTLAWFTSEEFAVASRAFRFTTGRFALLSRRASVPAVESQPATPWRQLP